MWPVMVRTVPQEDGGGGLGVLTAAGSMTVETLEGVSGRLPAVVGMGHAAKRVMMARLNQLANVRFAS